MGSPFRGTDPGSSEDQTGVTGKLSDLVARLTAGLVAPQAIMAATKAVPGILRLATDAEALAATIDTVALTPKQVLALVRGNPFTVASIAALNQIAAASVPDGARAVVGRYQISSGVYHRASEWQMTNGLWLPVGRIFYVEANDTNGTVGAAQAITDNLGANAGTARVPPGTIAANYVNGQQAVWTNAKWAYGYPEANSLIVNAPVQNVTTSWVQIPFVLQSPRPEVVAGGYTIPRDGYYSVHTRLRWQDGPPSDVNVGVNHLINGYKDDNFATWSTFFKNATGPSAQRLTSENTRLILGSAGQVIGATAYADGGTLSITSGVMEIVPVGF